MPLTMACSILLSMATTLAPEALPGQKAKRPRYPLGSTLSTWQLRPKFSICPGSSSPASLPPWPRVPGTLSPKPVQEAAPPSRAGSPRPRCRPELRVEPRAGPGAHGRAWPARPARATGKQWGRAAQGVPPPAAHSGAGQKGRGRTYRAPKLARNSSSARKLPACSPAAHGARPAPCPALLGPAPPPSASGCLCLGLQQLLLTAQRPQGRSDGGSQRGGDPPLCVPYPRPFPGCCTAGNGDRRRTARSEIPLAAQPPPAPRLRELWPVVYLLSSLTETTSPPSREEKKEMLKLCS